MARDDLTYQLTMQIGATRYPMRAIETVTMRAVDYLRSMVRSQMPWAREYKVPNRLYRMRSTPLSQVADVAIIIHIEHDGRPLPPKMKELRDFNMIQRAIRNGTVTSEDRKVASMWNRVANKLGTKR